MAEVKLDDLKPNSHKYKKEQAEKTEERERRHEAITTDVTVSDKKSLGKKFADAFIAEDIRSVKRYVVRDVIIPALIGMFVDSVTNGVEMMFGVNSTRRTGGKGGFNSAYSSYFKSGARNDRRNDVDDRNTRHDYRDIIFRSKDEAESVLWELQSDTNPETGYGQTSISDLYDLVDVTPSFQDRAWGWTDLGTARVQRCNGGWRLDLPKPVYLGER